MRRYIALAVMLGAFLVVVPAALADETLDTFCAVYGVYCAEAAAANSAASVVWVEPAPQAAPAPEPAPEVGYPASPTYYDDGPCAGGCDATRIPAPNGGIVMPGPWQEDIFVTHPDGWGHDGIGTPTDILGSPLVDPPGEWIGDRGSPRGGDGSASEPIQWPDPDDDEGAADARTASNASLTGGR